MRVAAACIALLLGMLPVAATAAMETLRVARYDTGGVQLPAERLLQAALHEAGINAVLVDMPLGRSLAETSRGVLLDADPARTLEAAATFPNLVAVNEPVREISLGAFVRSGAPPVTGWSSLQGRRLVTFSGAVIVERLLKENGLADAYRADTYTGAALMLAFGRADVAILPVDEARAALGRYGITLIQPSGPPLATTPLYIILNKRHAALASRIAAALRHQKALQKEP